MKNLVLSFLSLVLVSVLITEIAQASTPVQDVKKIITVLKERNYKNVILEKNFGGTDLQIVFVDNGLRYTVYYTGVNTTKEFISFWVRPEGTSGLKFLSTFTDHDLDGVVDFGIKGSSDGTIFDSKIFNVDEVGIPKTTLFRDYWQEQLDAAYKAALRRLL